MEDNDFSMPLLRQQRPASRFATFTGGPLPEFATALFVLLLATALLVAIDLRGGNIGVALKDPATHTGGPFYLGAVSNAGVIALVVAATATMMAAACNTHPRRLFVLVSLLSGLLAADDLLLIHEGPIRDVLPWFETFMFALYGCAAAGVLWMQRACLLRLRHIALLLSVGFLALSVLLDAVISTSALPDATEDLSKLLGFVLWSAYWSRLSLEALQDRL